MHHDLEINRRSDDGDSQVIVGDCSCGAWLRYLVEGERTFAGSGALFEGQPGVRCPAVACLTRYLDRNLVR